MGEDRVIYVGGCMRSGTTLVQRLLSAAKGASPLAAECQYLTALLDLRESWAPRFEEFLKDYFPNPAAFDGHSRKIVDEFLVAAFARFRPARTLVLKNPELSRHFPVLAQWYPAARFVLVVRDPLDTIASIAQVAQRHHESGVPSLIATYRTDMARLSALYKHYYEPVLRGLKLFGDRLLVLRYEDLVGNPDRVLGQLSHFTGLKLGVAALAAPPEAERAYWRDRRDSAYVGAFRSPLWSEPLSDGEIGRYAERLSAEQIGEIRRHCADVAISFNYWQKS